MHKFTLLASLLLIMVLGSSCGSNKSMIYLQDADELYKNGADLASHLLPWRYRSSFNSHFVVLVSLFGANVG